jgi:hypothetical protein
MEQHFCGSKLAELITLVIAFQMPKIEALFSLKHLAV